MIPDDPSLCTVECVPIVCPDCPCFCWNYNEEKKMCQMLEGYCDGLQSERPCYHNRLQE